MAIAQRYQPTPFENAVELIEAERYDEAFAALESVRASGKEIPDVHSLEAECFMHKGDMAGARASLEKALALRSTPQDLYNLAVLLYGAGEQRQAHELWVQGLRLDPDDIDLAQGVQQPYE
jgi:tetratricopeptide (TPR) repeat protein